MDLILFITEPYLKENSSISLNVETKLIQTAIADAQTIHIHQSLGTKLYKKIYELISTGDISLPINADYETLMDYYIIPAMISWSVYNTIINVRWKIMNKSVNSQSSDNTTPAELEEIKFLLSNLKDKAEFNSQRIVDYICANVSLYPEYTNPNLGDLQPEKTSYSCGLVLDDDSTFAAERFLGLNSHIIKGNI